MRYDIETASIELSVRELCAMALGGGDLEFGGGRALLTRGRQGAQIHRRIQAERSAAYQAEVPLSNTCLLDGLCYMVSGRADGIDRLEDDLVVEEIKSKTPRQFYLPASEMDTAQLRVYAYFYCCTKNLPGIHTRMIYVNTEDDRVREMTAYETVDQLREYYHTLLRRIARWAKWTEHHTLRDLPILAALPFPYKDMRLGQEDMIRAVHRAIRKGRRLFVQAPTGIGKTMSSLYPAVRARGEGRCDRIFYLTAKASTRREAFEATRRLSQCGAPLKAIILTAREQICLHPFAGKGHGPITSHCNSIECEYARGYYDRSGDAIYELLTTANGFNRRNITEVAQKYKVCPYELSLDLSEMCDVIIGDYNYAFDPMVYLRRYFGATAPSAKHVFLIDEAHNLVDRAREMYSAQLTNRDFERVRELADARDRVLCEALDTVIAAMQGLRALCREDMQYDDAGREYGFYLSRTPLESFDEKLRWFTDRCESWLRAHREEEAAVALGELLYLLHEYRCVMEHYDGRFSTYVEVVGDLTRMRLYCIDPSHVLDVAMNGAISCVLFSATLTPLQYFSTVLGGGERAEQLALPSPFDRDNFGLFALSSISTRYAHREESYRRIARCIAATVSAKKGNYIVYFPSYTYLEEVLKLFRLLYPKITTVVQSKDMRLAERESFLDAFAADDALRVGFCVLGGSFSEGVDLPGARLIGVLIVGVGLPGISNQQNVLQEYYQDRFEMGYEYVYLYPGMNRVLQAAGRVIRREQDRGVVVLIDDRYETPVYQGLFPPHWKHVRFAGNASQLAELVGDFWSNTDKNAH